MKRSPFPVPYGWFQVGWATDVAIGETKPLRYFGKHLVLWRDEDGGVHVQDAFCPHLGAHLGHGGKVAAGDVIGYVGNTGDAKGGAPHLHLEIRPLDGRPVNPYPVITAACG